METKKKLIMTFKTIDGKKVSITVDDPRTDLTEAQIKSAMVLILSKDIFAPNGEGLATLVDAKIVATDTQEFDLVM